MTTNGPTKAYPFLTLPIDLAELQRINGLVRSAGVAYKMGAKPPMNAAPGAFRTSDCSGFVRWLLYQVGANWPDGSANQHEAVRNAKILTTTFKRSEVDALRAKDGALRVAFLPAIGKEVGHVALWLDGLSMECCGTRGVCRRSVDECAHWLASASIYVLTAPKG